MALGFDHLAHVLMRRVQMYVFVLFVFVGWVGDSEHGQAVSFHAHVGSLALSNANNTLEFWGPRA